MPQARGGRSIASINTAGLGRSASAQIGAVGAGLSSIGGGLDKVAHAASLIDLQDRKRQEFETDQKFQEFDWNQRLSVDQSMRQIEPGTALTFPDAVTQSYQESASEFFKTVPDHLKAQYEAKLYKTERDLYSSTATFAREADAKFTTDSLKKTSQIFQTKARGVATEDLDAEAEDYNKSVDLAPNLSPLEKTKLKDENRRAMALSHVDSLPPEQAQELINGRLRGAAKTIPDQIVQIESGGRYNAKNPRSSASGPGQFISDTWLDMVKRNRPDVAEGRSDSEILALRTDPDPAYVKLNKEMVAAYAAENTKRLEGSGIQPTPGNVYLAHFLGPGDAVKVLTADPGTPLANILPAKSYNANRSIMDGKSAGDLAAWSDRKMSGAMPTALASLDDKEWAALQTQTDRRMATQQTETAVATAGAFERSIIDAGAGRGMLPDRSAIETNPALDVSRRNTLLRQYDAAAKDVLAFHAGMSKFMNPEGGSFNPYDTNDRKVADKIFESLGGGPQILQAVVERTKILPSKVAVGLHGDMISGNTERVKSSLTIASNLLSANPNIFEKIEGKSDFENNAIAFRTYVDDYGMTADEAAKRIIRDQSPEYKASVKARLKTEDIDAKIKKELSIGDLAGAFDQIPWVPFTDPKIGFDPKSRQEMFSQYAELVKDRYLETGDWSVSKKQAADQLKKTWGVSSINGSSVVMQYPPERAPAYAGLTDPASAISKQAIAAVKEESGIDVDRSGVRLLPILGKTGQAYKSGQPVPYMLMWSDKDGVVHMLNPGRAFVADPTAMKAAQSEERRTAMESAREDVASSLETRSVHRAQQQASRKALAGKDTSQEIEAIKAAQQSKSKQNTSPRFTQIPADSQEARGLPGGGEELSNNVGALVESLKKQPIVY